MKEKVAKLLLPRGSYGDDWYDHWGDCGGGGGWWTGSPGSPDNPYELPEVIVTPSGNHVDYSYYHLHILDNQAHCTLIGTNGISTFSRTPSECSNS